MKKETLDELGVKFSTDKSSLLHGYLEHYERLFPEPEKITKVVELGLQRRSGKWKNSPLPSVNMWLEFFPNATVFGFDKQDLKGLGGNRFHFYKGDQGRMKHHLEFGEITGDDIDFVLDDASHRFPHQVLSFLYFYPKLKNGGVYVVEDTRAKVQDEYPTNLRAIYGFEAILKNMMIPEENYFWVPSKSAGEKSSLVIIKK